MITPKDYLKGTLKDWGSALLAFATLIVVCIVVIMVLLWIVSVVRYWFIPIIVVIGAIIGIAIECHERYKRDKKIAKAKMQDAVPVWFYGANSFTSKEDAVKYRDQVMNEMQSAWEKYVSLYGEDEDALFQRDYNARTIQKINAMIDEGEWE